METEVRSAGKGNGRNKGRKCENDGWGAREGEGWSMRPLERYWQEREA